MVDAILKKNLTYVDSKLKDLKSLDYKTFNEADKWLKNAKVKLDNFQANNDNPHYIAFDMLTNAKTEEPDAFNQTEDNLLMDDNEHKNTDIMVHGERIAEVLGKVKTINPNLLASQLNQLSLQFDDKQFEQLDKFSKFTAIEGVEISQEELDAFQDAANIDAGQDAKGIQDDFFNSKPIV